MYKNNTSLYPFSFHATIQLKVDSNLNATQRFDSTSASACSDKECNAKISDEELAPDEGSIINLTRGTQHRSSEHHLNESKSYNNSSDSNKLHVHITHTRTEETSRNRSNSTFYHVINDTGTKNDGLVQVNKGDDISVPLCTRQQILNGSWVPTTLPIGPP